MTERTETSMVEFEEGMTSTDVERQRTARELTDEIKSRAEEIWGLLGTAYESAAWLDLGYSNWDEYCTAEFGDTIPVPTGPERQRVISLFSEAGMSTREIESATGVDHVTVSRSLHVSNETTVDLESEAPDEDADVEQSSDEIVDAELVDEPIVDETGKPAFPLNDKTATKVVPLVRRLAAQLEAIAADKRWTSERRKINATLRQPLGELRSALDVIGAK